jgi:hypothetical protein
MQTDTSLPLDLGFDPNSVDTSYPIIPAGTYKAGITKTEIKSKSSGEGEVLKVSFQIDQEVTTESGALIPAGMHKLSKSYSLDPEHAAFIIRLHDAVHGSKQGTRPDLVPADWEGKQILLQVKIEPERTDKGREYPRGNSVGSTSFLRQ